MDLVLLFAGLFLVLKRDYGAALGIVVVLASSFLGVALEEGGVAQFPFPHNVQDTGLVLYALLFVFSALRSRGTFYRDVMFRPILGLWLFLLVSGCVDIVVHEYPLGDVLRNARTWAFLSIVLIHRHFSECALHRALKVVLYATVFLCAVLLLQRATGVHLLGDSRAYDYGGQTIDRGVKPPFYLLLCCYLLYVRHYAFPTWKRWLLIGVLCAPVVLSLKVSYLVAMLLGFVVIEILRRRTLASSVATGIGATAGAVIVVIALFAVSPVLQHRVLDTVRQLETVQTRDADGNFAYRLLHFEERFQYCVSLGPGSVLFGIGSISERNFRGSPFVLGQIEKGGSSAAQIDTGDIAWSLLILRLGLVGIGCFVAMYICLLRHLLNYRHHPVVIAVAAYLFVNLVAMSLSTTNIAASEFFLLPLLVNSVHTRRPA